MVAAYICPVNWLLALVQILVLFLFAFLPVDTRGTWLNFLYLFFTENHSAPPDVTTYTSEHSIQVERPQGSTARVAPKYGNAELMETGDGMSQSKMTIVIFLVVTVCI